MKTKLDGLDLLSVLFYLDCEREKKKGEKEERKNREKEREKRKQTQTFYYGSFKYFPLAFYTEQSKVLNE